jgi:acyl-coenzyme A synthetase/AMP-(fatty) acid ligase
MAPRGAGYAFRHSPQLPKTSTGKTQKFKLRDMAKGA